MVNVLPGLQSKIAYYGKIPTRFNVGFMLFMASFTFYMLRVNISINIIAMVQPKLDITPTIYNNLTLNNETNSIALQELPKIVDLPDYGPRYYWSKHDQSLILGAFFWGYLFPNLFGGMMAEYFGGRNLIGFTLLLSGVVTAISPLAANNNIWQMFAIRLLLGVLSGFFYPAAHTLISKWSPPDEKGKFVSALMGSAFGTVITLPVAGIIIEKWGWKFAFYIPALFTLLVTMWWFYVVSDTPDIHPRIEKKEKEQIQKSLGGTVTKTTLWPPIGQLLTSWPFYALLILHYGNNWGLFFLLTAAPKFMNEALHFNLSKAGFLSSLPYLMRLFLAFVFGTIGDFIRRKNLLTVTITRKSFCLFSHIIPGLLLIALCFAGSNAYVCVAIITLSLGLNGAATMTNLQNGQDLAPNFAGSLYGIINFVGTTSGFISPILVAHFTKHSSTLDEWQYVFYIGAAVYIIPALFFIVFGSGKVQSFNEPKRKDAVDNESTPVSS